MRATTPLTALAAEDAPAAVALANSVGWNDTLPDWETLLECGKVLGCRDESGTLLGTCTACDFGPVVTIAKMIVREHARGRGLARALLDRCLATRTEGAAALLIATPLGQPLYERTGFVTVETIHVMMGTLARRVGSGGSPVEAFDPRDRDALLALDRSATGGERARMLDARLARASRAVVVRHGSEVRAFGVATPQRDVTVVGPVIATDLEAALDVIDALGEGSARVRVDVPGMHGLTVDRLTAAGLGVAGSRPEMALEGRIQPRRSDHRFALATQAYC